MGRPYVSELSRLSETYVWALGVPIDALAAAVSACASFPLLAVGSGGSFSAAHLACLLHQRHAGKLARPTTPLELLSSPINLRSLAVMVLSAGGSNADILSALESAACREPRRCAAFCLRERSSLSRLAQSYRFVDLVELAAPWGKDGFLATNSLLAFAVLLVRAYNTVSGSSEQLPRSFDALLAYAGFGSDGIGALRARSQALWERNTLVMLYGPNVSSAAVDLESKFSEAALGNTQLADFRNFAHGRHHWLAKHASTTAVVAMFSSDEQDLADKTLALIPRTTPVVRICLPHTGSTAAVAGLVAVLHLVGFAGQVRGIDPGRPGVPAFGRRIYRLRTPRTRIKVLSSTDAAPIARKLGCDVQALSDRTDLAPWQDAQRRFLADLARAVFGAIVLDYDGTLCDERDRFTGVRPDVVGHLSRLLMAGIPVGVATGRGRSVREDFRKALPKRLWRNVYVGYYNAADIGSLSEDGHPNPSLPRSESLDYAADLLVRHPAISAAAVCEPRSAQVSVQPTVPAWRDLTWRVVEEVAQVHDLRAITSSHSVDLVTRQVSKRSLLTLLESGLRDGTRVLLIGDKGRWPGNDFDLLRAPLSLSVDEVSADPNTCWNLAPPGYRGVQATLVYLNAIQISKGTFRLAVPRLLSPTSARRFHS